MRHTIAPKWPRIYDIDVERSIIDYDRDSDTLFVHLYGRGRPAVSVLVSNYAFLLVDPTTDELVGFQIEDVLTQAVDEHPIVLDSLSIAFVISISLHRQGLSRALALGP